MTFIRGFSAAVWHSWSIHQTAARGSRTINLKMWENCLQNGRGTCCKTFWVYLLPQECTIVELYHFKDFYWVVYTFVHCWHSIYLIEKIKKTPCYSSGNNALSYVACKTKSKHDLIWINTVKNTPLNKHQLDKQFVKSRSLYQEE